MGTAEPGAEAPRLTLRRGAADAGVVRVDVAGEVDINTVPELRTMITTVFTDPGVSALLLDFAGLRFLDSSGLAALIGGYRTAQERGLRFVVLNSTGSVRNVLEVTGMYDVFTADGWA